MNWKEFIITTADKTEDQIGFEFNLPVTENKLFYLQEQFGLKELPMELQAFYRQTNGVHETMNGEVIGAFIWPVESVVQTNSDYRKNADFKRLYMSFDQLFFFADTGNGDLFGFSTLHGTFARCDVFIWDHEDDSRTWVAPNLEAFIEWRLQGKI
jgi:hypothetical protein